jgi:hypothetical protein
LLDLPVTAEVISDKLAGICGALSHEVFLGVTMSLNLLAVRLYLGHNCSSKRDAIVPYIFIKSLSHLRANLASMDFAAFGSQQLTLACYDGKEMCL